MPSPFNIARLAEEYWERGYVHLPGAVGPDELAALREEAAAQMDAGIREPASDFGQAPLADGSVVQYRVDAIVKKALVNESILVAMVHPVITAITRALFEHPSCGADALVFKGAKGGAIVPLHSAYGNPKVPETPWDRSRDICNVAIHLDPSTPETGCLLVVPGSHRLPRDEVLALTQAGLDSPVLVPLPTQPGDITLHSEYIVHGSRPTPPGGALRRVLYFAFGFTPGYNRTHAARALLARYAAERRPLAPYAAGEPAPSLDVAAEFDDVIASLSDEEVADAFGTIRAVAANV